MLFAAHCDILSLKRVCQFFPEDRSFSTVGIGRLIDIACFLAFFNGYNLTERRLCRISHKL
jgi:hypothetical protein